MMPTDIFINFLSIKFFKYYHNVNSKTFKRWCTCYKIEGALYELNHLIKNRKSGAETVKRTIP